MIDSPSRQNHELVLPHGDLVESQLPAIARYFEGLELDGQATVPTHAWDMWAKTKARGTFSLGEEPNRWQTLSYDEITTQDSGWKLHLNFDPKDPDKLKAIDTLLNGLTKYGAVSSFKLGHGGGKASGQPGKEATLYVGHHDMAVAVASILEDHLLGVLDGPEGDVLVDDVPFSEHVAGRFDIGRIDPEIHQYGARGHGLLDDDVGSMFWERRVLSETQYNQLKAQAAARADETLRERYGAFYAGAAAMKAR